MGIRNFIKRLERGARGNSESFILEDGSRHYFDPGSGELFLHTSACLRADHAGRERPEPPTTLLALCKARDRRAAVEQVASSGLFPYSKEAIVELGELVDRSMVAPPREDLSE